MLQRAKAAVRKCAKAGDIKANSYALLAHFICRWQRKFASRWQERNAVRWRGRSPSRLRERYVHLRMFYMQSKNMFILQVCTNIPRQQARQEPVQVCNPQEKVECIDVPRQVEKQVMIVVITIV